jgi:hypothetical protein
VPGDSRRSGIRLASPNADGVVTSGNDGVAIFSDHDQIAVLQVEVDFLARARLQMDLLESAESDLRRTLDRRELDVDLDGLISCNFPRVGYCDIGVDRFARQWLPASRGRGRGVPLASEQTHATTEDCKHVDRHQPLR